MVTNKGLLGSACLIIIAHFGGKLFRKPDFPLAQPMLRTRLRLFPAFLAGGPVLFEAKSPRQRVPQGLAIETREARTLARMTHKFLSGK